MSSLVKDAGVFLSEYGLQIGALFAFGLCAYALSYFPRKVPAKGETDMGTIVRAEFEKERRVQRIKENNAVEDMIIDGLLQLLVDGQLTDTGYRRWMDKFAVFFGHTDWRRDDPMTPDKLKELLKKRRNGGSYHGIYTPVKFPTGDVQKEMNALEKLLASKLS